MRRVRYNVAASLDGFIAGPGGDYGWIPQDPTVDFAALFAKVDTVLLGRVSWEVTKSAGPAPWATGTRVHVFSRTMPPATRDGVTIATDAVATTARLRAEQGDGEIWLFGGGTLFRSLLDARQVDSIEVTIVPVLLGGGIPLAPPGTSRTSLVLTDTRRYPSGMVTLSYQVPDATR